MTQIEMHDEKFPQKPVRLNSGTPASVARPSPRSRVPLFIVGVFMLGLPWFILYTGILHPLWRALDLPAYRDKVTTSGSCPSTATVPYRAGQLKYAFDVSSPKVADRFTFIQDQERDVFGHPLRVAGQVIVHETKSSENNYITVDLDVKLSHDELARFININVEDHTLRFRTPASVENVPRGQDASVCVIATVSVPESVEIGTLDLSTIALPVDFTKGSHLHAKNINVRTVSGRVSSNGLLDSKYIEVETSSAPITGSYPLANLLSLKSVSGSITADVKPEAGDRGHEGTFLADSKSGSIRISTDTHRIPEREYISEVSTVSGTVSGQYILGSSSTFQSMNGDVDIGVWTAGRSSSRGFDVSSISGTVNTKLHKGDYNIGDIDARLDTKSGTLTAQFTNDVEGKIDVSSTSGSLHIEGKDVKIIEDGRDRLPGMGRRIVAENGRGMSSIYADSVSGSVSVQFLSM